jgi:hypothetical protein
MSFGQIIVKSYESELPGQAAAPAAPPRAAAPATPPPPPNQRLRP